ncbi:DNA directed RNA polymerase [Filobasidium floriforme]|uniref:DNA directed RNA polymerase n=1 Tax=Filobasidium floriforme TaxID=5210 RepID=UPI001E8E58F6|nr:DNA directed RNA polymerase [Filobasidium floriforme]KAH8084720.1 DNA directed RNA polymerase [Filobasidium floriforme]
MSQIPASQHGTQNFQPHPTMFPVPQTPKKHKYICAECNADNEIKAGEPIRCRDCGHRIFYKPRTTKMVSAIRSSMNPVSSSQLSHSH